MNRILTSLFQEILFLAKRLNICLMLSLALMTTALCAQTVSDVSFAPRHPWNGLVDITFRIDGTPEQPDDYLKGLQIVANNYKGYSVVFTGYDQGRNATVEIGQTANFTKAGTYTRVWNAAADYPEFAAKDFRIQAQLVSEIVYSSAPAPQGNSNSTYLVIDLSDGKDASYFPCRYTNDAPNLSRDACRTTELWLRRIPKGTFLMGSPSDQWGRQSNEAQHEVTLTRDFYIGVFEMTEKQYKLVMGGTSDHDIYPMHYIFYNALRGTSAEGGAGWPEKGHAVDAGSFFGVLRTKTGLLFDLPTEAQWEYACRAGTTTALNSGKNLTAIGECPNMAEVGRYRYNQEDGKGKYSEYWEYTKVGSYLPNAWGLYDMHGNVCEWCLDWYGYYPTKAVTDPAGAGSGSYRVQRGGSWRSDAEYCRSASRKADLNLSYSDDSSGFRVVCLP